MLIRTTLAAACLAVGLSACENSVEPAEADESPPAAAAEEASAGMGAGAAIAEAEREAVIMHVAMDTEECFLPEGAERETEIVDLGDGVGAVIVTCSTGNRDVWNRLYIVQEGGGHHMAVPLIQYDIRGDGEWRRESTSPNLTWLPDERVFHASHSDVGGCGGSTRWRWDGQEVALVQQTVTEGCEGLGPNDQIPDPRIVWPTDPETPEPTGV